MPSGGNRLLFQCGQSRVYSEVYMGADLKAPGSGGDDFSAETVAAALFGTWRYAFACTRAVTEEIPDWFRNALAATLLRP